MVRCTPFIGRRRELEVLDHAYAHHSSAFIPVYGRRRVGKSELILKFIERRPAIYLVGKTAPAALHLRELSREAARVLDEPLLAELEPKSWKHLLTLIDERWPEDKKLVLALDEFQWLAQASPELPSVLQELWDRRWQRSGRVMLILCGSYVGFMEREVLGQKSPLFGRRTAQILLRPFDHAEASRFHPNLSLEDQARTYFICGGVPFYLKLFDDARSVEQNIASAVLDEYAPLFREPDFLLREELREVDSYYAVLLAIATGNTSAGSIAERSGLPERSLHYYLRQLEELGYIARRHPLTGLRPVARNVRYVLEDPLLAFWFRFVFPNLSFIQQMGPRRALKDRIRPELAAYFGGCFERLARQALPVLYQREGVEASFTVGEYWDRATQIDVVGLRDDNWTDLGECKWGRVSSAAAVIRELDERVQRYPNHRGASIGRRVFVRKAPPRLPQSPVTWHTLEDLYA